MRKFDIFASQDDWDAYLKTAHHKILCAFAEDTSASEPICILPDLAPDKGLPSGSIFTTTGVIYPYAVGQDIGCGYTYGILRNAHVNAESPYAIEHSLQFATDLADPKMLSAIFFDDYAFSPSFVTTLHNQQAKGRLTPKIREYLYNAAIKQVGKISPGNHFVEIHQITAQFQNAGIPSSQGEKVLIIHNGSGVIGDILTGLVDVKFGFREERERDPIRSFPVNSKHGPIFIGVRSIAINFARYHRYLIAKKVGEIIGAELEILGDNNHTDIFSTETDVFHYSGVSQVDEPGKLMFVGGSVGARSSLVISQKEVQRIRGISHGAGVKFYEKKESTQVMNQPYTNLRKKTLAELSKVHRSVDESVKALEKTGLVETIADLDPLLIYKIAN